MVVGFPPLGGGSRPPDTGQSHASTTKGSTYASKTKGNLMENVRMYAEIVARHKKERSMIEIKFTKQRKDGGDWMGEQECGS